MKALLLLLERPERSAIDAQTVGTERKQGTRRVDPSSISPWLRAMTVPGTAEMSLPLKPWLRWWMVNPNGKALILFFSSKVRIKCSHVGA